MNSDEWTELSAAELPGANWPARLAPSVVAHLPSASSARRSFSLDVTSTEGLVHVTASGRDVVMNEGEPTVTDVVTLDLTYADDELLTIESLSVGPAERAAVANVELQGMLGRSGRLGFRGAVRQALDPIGDPPASLLRSMLHDVPIAVVIRRSADSPDEVNVSAVPYQAPVDGCAGYRSQGVLQLWTSQRGPRRLGIGPRADPIEDAADRAPFPDLGPRPLGVTSRRRRIDVSIDDDDVVAFESMFRDSVLERVEPVGVETVVHEYVVSGRLAADGETIEACIAHPIVLPAPDCPMAAASAGRLVGLRAVDVQRTVRAEFNGTTTCTHLNDALWMVGVVPELVRQVALTAGSRGSAARPDD
jgi:hypothetical protein